MMNDFVRSMENNNIGNLNRKHCSAEEKKEESQAKHCRNTKDIQKIVKYAIKTITWHFDCAGCKQWH